MFGTDACQYHENIIAKTSIYHKINMLFFCIKDPLFQQIGITVIAHYAIYG
jgi:hypothetical protein